MISTYCVLVMVLTLASTNVRSQRAQNSPQALCGRRLADALSIICINNGQFVDKKSADSMMENEDSKEMWPWLARRYVNALSAAARAKRIAGLVDECCHKPCYLDQLISYC